MHERGCILYALANVPTGPQKCVVLGPVGLAIQDFKRRPRPPLRLTALMMTNPRQPVCLKEERQSTVDLLCYNSAYGRDDRCDLPTISHVSLVKDVFSQFMDQISDAIQIFTTTRSKCPSSRRACHSLPAGRPFWSSYLPTCLQGEFQPQPTSKGLVTNSLNFKKSPTGLLFLS
jgi:hypothetical protein